MHPVAVILQKMLSERLEMHAAAVSAGSLSFAKFQTPKTGT